MSLDYRRMMQENLDGTLEHEFEEQLLEHLSQDLNAAEENAKLERVHSLLTKPPLERAPQRLAMTIMARLAQTLQEKAEMEALPEEMQQALMLGWSVVSITMMPMMVAQSYLVLNAMASPKALQDVMNQVIYLQVMMIEALIIILEEVEQMLQDDPQMAPVALSLIPIALIGILEAVYDGADHMDMLDR